MSIYHVAVCNPHHNRVIDLGGAPLKEDGTLDLSNSVFERNIDHLRLEISHEIATIWERAYSLLQAAYHYIESFFQSDPDKGRMLGMMAQADLTTFWTGTLRIIMNVYINDGTLPDQLVGTNDEKAYLFHLFP